MSTVQNSKHYAAFNYVFHCEVLNFWTVPGSLNRSQMSALKQLVTRRSELHRLKYLESFGDNDDGVWFELNDGIKQQEDNHELQSEPGEQSALRSTNHVEGKGASHDSVDMAIKGAKDVSHGIKRPFTTDGDMVYIFSWIDILIAVGSIIVFIVDIITDIKLAVEYYRDSQWTTAGVTTALIVIPSLITCGLSLHWYIIDFKIEEQVILKSKEVQKRVYAASEKLWFCRFFFTVLQLGPLVRYVILLFPISNKSHALFLVSLQSPL